MTEISLAVCGDQATLAYSAIGRTRLTQARDLIALSQDERFRWRTHKMCEHAKCVCTLNTNFRGTSKVITSNANFCASGMQEKYP